ncbi:MAG: deoxyribonuclease V [Anaerolineales bacterium]|nr:deoxyribonuclease V [Anaerolineales bacterium]
MKFEENEWSITPQRAIAIQEELKSEVILEDRLGSIRLVAGTDVSYIRSEKVSRAAVAILSFPDLNLVDSATSESTTEFPYIPGLLSFREIPAIMSVIAELERLPDLIICDGHGYAHPRRFGLASHLGILCDIPTIGVAKRLLTGTHKPVPNERGAWVPIIVDGETIGAALRSREYTKPIYVSIGHRVSLETAIDLTMECTTRYRLPETTRMAHKLSKTPLSSDHHT